MKNKDIIGILGGMGPSASGYLYNMINTLAVREYGVRKNHEFPETILYSVPVPDFISSNRNKEKALKMLKARVVQLNALPMKTMGIACNTAHMLLPELQKVSKAHFISMIDEVVEYVDKKNIKTVGLLATSSTIRAGLYKNALQKLGITVIVPAKKEQIKIDTLAKTILAEQATKRDQEVLASIADRLVNKGAETIVLGCTELPLLFPKTYKVLTVNSVEVLARALLKKTMI